jgi:hypothetical protein
MLRTMSSFRPLLFALFAGLLPLRAEEPAVEKLDETRFRIGLVTLDQKTREIRLPAAVNLTDGLLEFALVHRNGKVHESLLVTDASPVHLNVALKLLRYPASPDPSAGDDAEAKPAAPAAGSRLDLAVEWRDGERTRRVPLHEWVLYDVTGEAMPAGAWIYGGGENSQGEFLAGSHGDVIAIYSGNPALLYYEGKDRGNDEVWRPFAKRMPVVGTAVTLILTPHASIQP